MIEALITSLSIEEIATYLGIFIMIFALSPYGIHVLRKLFAYAAGQPQPSLPRQVYRTRRGSPMERVIETAETEIGKLVQIISDLRDELGEAHSRISCLEAEKEALIQRIRDLSGETGPSSEEDVLHTDRQRHRDLETLGLDPGRAWSWPEVRTAFRQQVLRHHPDRGGSDESLRAVTEAYDRLKTTYA